MSTPRANLQYHQVRQEHALKERIASVGQLFPDRKRWKSVLFRTIKSVSYNDLNHVFVPKPSLQDYIEGTMINVFHNGTSGAGDPEFSWSECRILVV